LSEYILLGIASILTFGMIAQWLAWYLRLPSILLLLIFGFIAGPITGLLKPDELMGEALFPLVSSAVALILFEGGLSLKISELRSTGHVVRNLISIGVLLTWVMCVGAALWILGLPLSLALLFGAILVVTGPTVIIPLLRHIRATSQISSIIKWEGIVNDPIGAVLAVLVFEAILVTGFQSTAISVMSGLITTLLIGLVGGGVGAILLIFLLQRYWIPDYLQNGIILMTVLVTFVGSNLVQAESGLLTVTLM
jgi:NhaP-type Na+/H+ or K+/H+ antiporter